MAATANRRAAHDHEQCIQEALKTAAEVCAARGTRLTDLRRRVLELIWSGHVAVKAYDLLAMLGEGTKPPTVYRALEFLVDNGLVHRIESLNAFVGCAAPEEAHQSNFLICDSCGFVEEIADPKLRHSIVDRARSAGFAPERLTVEVLGRCRSCAAEAV